jgi:uncharacterized protein YndB with AHSA1/START domain
VVRRTIRAPVERVFDAWTRPEHLVRWWGPRPVRCSGAEVDLRVGGRYRIGNQLPDGKILWIVGEFEQVRPPHKLVYTWQLEPGEPSSERVTVRFEPRDGATEVIVVHERITRAEVRATHEQGWLGCFDGLEQFLAAA